MLPNRRSIGRLAACLLRKCRGSTNPLQPSKHDCTAHPPTMLFAVGPAVLLVVAAALGGPLHATRRLHTPPCHLVAYSWSSSLAGHGSCCSRLATA